MDQPPLVEEMEGALLAGEEEHQIMLLLPALLGQQFMGEIITQQQHLLYHLRMENHQHHLLLSQSIKGSHLHWVGGDDSNNVTKEMDKQKLRRRQQQQLLLLNHLPVVFKSKRV